VFRKLQFPHLRRGNSPRGSQWQKIFLLLGSLQPLINTSHLQSNHLCESALPRLTLQNELGEQKSTLSCYRQSFVKQNKLKQVPWAASTRDGKLTWPSRTCEPQNVVISLQTSTVAYWMAAHALKIVLFC